MEIENKIEDSQIILDDRRLWSSKDAAFYLN